MKLTRCANASSRADTQVRRSSARFYAQRLLHRGKSLSVVCLSMSLWISYVYMYMCICVYAVLAISHNIFTYVFVYWLLRLYIPTWSSSGGWWWGWTERCTCGGRWLLCSWWSLSLAIQCAYGCCDGQVYDVLPLLLIDVMHCAKHRCICVFLYLLQSLSLLFDDSWVYLYLLFSRSVSFCLLLLLLLSFFRFLPSLFPTAFFFTAYFVGLPVSNVYG